MISPVGPILVVEDIPNILELVAMTLRFRGYEVVTAHNGNEALEQISTVRPVMVVTDILMPFMDGYTLVRKLHSSPETRDIPIIFLSATYTNAEDKEFALNLGASAFLEKPFETEDLLLTVAEILAHGKRVEIEPMDDASFYQGYRERVESKLRLKNTQIVRTQRLLESLSHEQRAPFEAMLAQLMSERDQILTDLKTFAQSGNKAP